MAEQQQPKPNETAPDQAKAQEQAQEAPSRGLRLKLVSDGTPGGTKLQDAESGREVSFDAHVRCDLAYNRPGDGTGRVVIAFQDVAVKAAEGYDGGPFQLFGVVSGKPAPTAGASPGAFGAAPSTRAPQAEAQPQPAGAGGVRMPTAEEAREWNRRQNEQQGR